MAVYIARESPDNADRFLENIEEKCQALAAFPNMGINRDELGASLRSLPVENYVIFFMPIEDGIDIVRVLQGMRDIEAIL